jgi:hypothetical protein
VGVRPAGWRSGGDDLVVRSENSVFTEKKIPIFTPKTRTEKESLRNSEIEQCVATVSILVGRSALIIGPSSSASAAPLSSSDRGQCGCICPRCTRCLMRAREGEDATERKPGGGGSSQAAYLRLMSPARLPCAEAAGTLTFSGNSSALSIFAAAASRRRMAKAKPQHPSRDGEYDTDVLLCATSRAGKKRRPPRPPSAFATSRRRTATHGLAHQNVALVDDGGRRHLSND